MNRQFDVVFAIVRDQKGIHDAQGLLMWTVVSFNVPFQGMIYNLIL
jgi:hypothetical protein